MPRYEANADAAAVLPLTESAYRAFAENVRETGRKAVTETKLWPVVFSALRQDLAVGAAGADALPAPAAELIAAAQAADLPPLDAKAAFLDIDAGWSKIDLWQTLKAYSPPYTAGYFLNAVDLEKTPDGVEMRPDSERIYIKLFWRTLWMSLSITLTACCSAIPSPGFSPTSAPRRRMS